VSKMLLCSMDEQASCAGEGGFAAVARKSKK
jgi:hypothetical protein